MIVQDKRSWAAWFLQRVTALYLAVFLVEHLLSAVIGTQYPLDMAGVAARLDSGWFWFVQYVIFLPVVLYHTLNGLFGVILDREPAEALVRISYRVLWLVGLVVLIWGEWFLFRTF
jgi:succinate dehydrogenase/fumarate reductase cytochrome b subunit